MRLQWPVWAAVFLGAVCAVAQTAASGPSIPSTTLAINSPTPLSQRVVHYEIDAKYDAKKHALDATETLTYHNLTGQPLDTFPFHLYLNAFQPASTMTREGLREGFELLGFYKWDAKYYAADEINSFEVVGQGDFTSQLQFIHPDDDNQDDHTVVQVHLPQPVAPDGYVQFKIRFHDQFGEVLQRTGWNGDFVLGGQWFPKVGVWWHGAWNCHQFHAFTEFFADFGVYDVRLTVPQDEVVGASGIEVNSVNNPDGTKTVSYHGDDIHDFAWTACPRYRVHQDTFQSSMGPVKLIFLMQPAHWGQLQRHVRILKEAMDRDDRWYGPYPYKSVTMVDPYPFSAAAGMEYPTFITGGTYWPAFEGYRDTPEATVEHEFGHQYWYGMVATNEFEEAWLDEGINTYNDIKVLDSVFGPTTSLIDIWGATTGMRDRGRESFIARAHLDPLARFGWQYADAFSYASASYFKTGSALLTLEGLIGEDTMRRAMRTYFTRYRFTHPTGEDFLKTIEEVSGRDLRWYFNQAVYGTQVMDYAVFKVNSYPVDWYKDIPAWKKAGSEFVSNVWIQRKEDFIFPVDIEVTFDNGEKLREHWDGRDRWVRYEYRRKAQVESVRIDPDDKIYLDRNNFNNSFVVEGNPAPAKKLVNYWLFLSQMLAQWLSWWMA